MSCWGYEVFEDDYALDLKGEFEDLLDEGLTPLQATNRLVKNNDYLLEEKDDEDYPIFFLVIASLQMEHGCLQDEVKKEALNIIENDIGMEIWSDEGEEEYNKRKEVLNRMKEQLKGA